MKKRAIIIFFISIIVALLLIGTAAVFIISKNAKDAEELVKDSADMVDMLEDMMSSNVITDGDGVKINVSENINQEKLEIDGLELTNISLRYADDFTTFTADVFNNSDIDYPDGVEMKVYFYDDNGDVFYNTVLMTGTLMKQERTNINMKITLDCTDASDMEFEIINV